MKLGIGALALDRASVEDLVARFEQRDLVTDGVHDSGRIVAQYLDLALRRLGALAHVVVSRVDGDRLHGNPDITAGRLRLRRLEIDQSVPGVDGKRFLLSDGLHGWTPSKWKLPPNSPHTTPHAASTHTLDTRA